MNPSFEGFEGIHSANPNQLQPNTADSSAEVYEYEITVESTESTPTGNASQEISTVKRGEKTTRVSVRRLVG